MNTSEDFSYLLFHPCVAIFISISWIRFILLLPLSTYVLLLALQKWRQHRSFKAASHFDVFTYHLVAMESLWVLGYLCQICVSYSGLAALKVVASFMTVITFHGEILFHALTCVERYIAVVLPITYMKMRNSCGGRIRTISISCVWLLSLGLSSLGPVDSANISLLCLLGFTVTIMSFCSLSVLCALIRPTPGEKGGEKGTADQTKQRAFCTVAAISGVQWLWFLALLASAALSPFPLEVLTARCVERLSLGFCNLPCCLVLPLMYLHKAAKLPLPWRKIRH